MRPRTVAAPCLLAAALTTAIGCSSPSDKPHRAVAAPHHDTTASPSPTKAANRIHITDSGYGIYRAHDQHEDWLYAAAIVNNPTSNQAALTVNFTVYGPGGKVIGSDVANQAMAHGHATTAAGTQVTFPAGAKVAKVVANLTPANAGPDPRPKSHFTARGVHFQPDGYGDANVLGELHSSYQETIGQVYVAAVCYDKDHDIIGGGDTTIDTVAGGQTIGFKTDSVVTTGTPASCDAYPTLSVSSAN